MVSTVPWPFDQPRDCAVFVTREVLEGAEPILRVTHDADDHSWQFLGFSDGTSRNARVVALHEAAELDPSIAELADLSPGWHARRDAVGEPWIREVDSHATPTI